MNNGAQKPRTSGRGAVTAEIIPLADRLPTSRPGNGAREAVLAWLQGAPVANPEQSYFFEASADNLLAFLWVEGFKIVPLDGSE